jgi:hypothetical protein
MRGSKAIQELRTQIAVSGSLFEHVINDEAFISGPISASSTDSAVLLIQDVEEVRFLGEAVAGNDRVVVEQEVGPEFRPALRVLYLCSQNG